MKLSYNEVESLLIHNKDQIDITFSGVSTDSRSTMNGDLFVALKGEHFNGHDFLQQAFDRGASAAIVSEDTDLYPVIKVDDTLNAMGAIASYWHNQCQQTNVENSIPSTTLAITGSVGKTTVKEMICCLLENEISYCATKGNFNNLIGLPLTVFHEKPEDVLTVLEMGANQQDEIKQLCKIVAPDISIITQIAEAHLSGFNSIQGVAKAKSEIFKCLNEKGTAILNIDHSETELLLEAAKNCQLIKVSIEHPEQAEVWAENLKLFPEHSIFDFHTRNQKFTVKIALPGQHNVMNALLALSAVETAGLDVEKLSAKLSAMKTIKGRLDVHNLAQEITIIDDSYNANPTSVKAAIDMLSRYPQQKVVVLGDMAELGVNEKNLHSECGQYAAAKGIDEVYGLGELSKFAVQSFMDNKKLNGQNNDSEFYFQNRDGLIAALLKNFKNKVYLIKGSRSARMDLVVNELLLKANSNNNNKKECL